MASLVGSMTVTQRVSHYRPAKRLRRNRVPGMSELKPPARDLSRLAAAILRRHFAVS
jgi:hypothetical protein